ncbi:SAM-dependent methyltransferase (plasmid) [Azospirillum sp. TSA2s]|uniref:SAM-dependent methyltransferase n=1 Tax=Azospirillum sp. TSA2s TaxID=709810 RepID=UPI0010AB013A|nr:SAM-dependent methyltransferase [Azospirillum sp. TSA2s]QCG99408.1 SAM-dependent methyltransferase [Azospirillum sp. TSA2s]
MTPSEKKLIRLRQARTLEDLRTSFPRDWRIVERKISGILERGNPQDLAEFTKQTIEHHQDLTVLLSKTLPNSSNYKAYLSRFAQVRMAAFVIKDLSRFAGKNVKSQKLGCIDKFLMGNLLFLDGFRRKPVSMFWFQLIWPMIRQRHMLMPLVEPKGIYCFYSKELITHLAGLIGSRPCLEIAAGDGTLTRFLQDVGVSIIATDSHSWQSSVTYSDSVIKLDARAALRMHKTKVVLCSWPPANNAFERFVFETDHVELYLVIGSRYEFASGNWRDYRRQNNFTVTHDLELSRLVLPPELGCAVYRFERKAA